MGLTETTAVRARFFASDPPWLTGARCDLAIQAQRELGSDEWSPGQTVLDVELVEPLGPFLEHANGCRDAGALQYPQARSSHPLVGIAHRHDDACHSCVDYRLDTRWNAVGVGARLEGDVQRAIHGALAGRRQRLLLGVRFTSLAVKPLAGQEAG